MKEMKLTINDNLPGFDEARRQAGVEAEKIISEPMLISWFDKKKQKHSPSCLKCEIKGRQGWEVYGENHGGTLKISINEDEFVFIFG